MFSLQWHDMQPIGTLTGLAQFETPSIISLCSVPPVLFKINYTHTLPPPSGPVTVCLYITATPSPVRLHPALNTCGSFLSSATGSEPAWTHCSFNCWLCACVFVCHLHVYLDFIHLPTWVCWSATAPINQPIWLFLISEMKFFCSAKTV